MSSYDDLEDLTEPDELPVPIVRWQPNHPTMHGGVAAGGAAAGGVAIGSGLALAFPLGAVAVGAVAIGALAIGRLSIGSARFRRVEIDELVVGRLKIREP